MCLLLAASLALVLGMSSESSSSLVAWVSHSRGGDDKTGIMNDFLNAAIKSSRSMLRSSRQAHYHQQPVWQGRLRLHLSSWRESQPGPRVGFP